MLSEKNTRVTKQTILLTAAAVSTLLWGGCRSVPGLNRFVRSSEPSADVLAGTGPSATYPAPPSASATPQAIASVAGGTKAPATATSPGNIPAISRPSIGPPSYQQNAQVAGIDVSTGYATPATNYAAANANGVYGKPANSAGAATKPSPYTFGSKTFTPKTTPEPSAVMPSSNYASPAESSYAKSSFGLPATTAGIAKSPTSGPDAMAGTNYASPPSASPVSPTAATSIASNKGSQSGFTLPTSVPTTATASMTPPPSTTSTTSSPPMSFGMPGSESAAPAPVYSTANSSGSVSSSPTTSTPGTPASSAGLGSSISSGSPGVYMPGSTGANSGYPGAKHDAPATSGSYYR